MFQTKGLEIIETHILCSIIFSPENRAVYEITWKNIVEPDTGHRWQYGAYTFRAGYLRLQTHTQNM